MNNIMELRVISFLYEFTAGCINLSLFYSNYISTYFAAISLFRSRLLSRATKIILYKTLTRPVVSYGVEAWKLTKKEEQALQIFEGKYLEEYMVLNMKTGNGKVGRIKN